MIIYKRLIDWIGVGQVMPHASTKARGNICLALKSGTNRMAHTDMISYVWPL